MSQHEFERWQDGVLIQNAMPKMPAHEREMLITGTCAQCWDKMMSEPVE